MDMSAPSPAKAKVRDPLIDILKGIGIMSIVIGHSAAITFPSVKFNSTVFVYGYHIMIFMFVLGFLYQTNKSSTPFQYIGKTVFSMAKLYITYAIIFILLHNVLLKLGFITGAPFTWVEQIAKIIYSATFICEESMLGAFWFIPMYIFAAIVFSSMIYVAEKSKCPPVLHTVFIVVNILLVILSHNKAFSFNYHIQTSILALPVCYAGYFAKKYWSVIWKFVTWYGAIIAAVGLNLLLNTKYGFIELSQNMIMTPYLFYPVTLIGIYYCLGLAKIIAYLKPTRAVFAYVGKNSFHIMALHFVCLKLVDVIYGVATNQPVEVYSKFPFAFDLWYLYYPVGIFLPIGIIALCRLIKKYVVLGNDKLFAALMKRADGSEKSDS